MLAKRAVLCVHWFLFRNIFDDPLRQIIPGPTGPIFTEFSTSVVIWSRIKDLVFFFPITQGTLPWQAILWVKSAKSVYLPLFIALTFRNGSEYRDSDLRRFNGNDFSTLLVNVVRFSPVTQEFTTVVRVHPLVDPQWNYFRYVRKAVPLLGTAVINTQFCGASSSSCLAL